MLQITDVAGLEKPLDRLIKIIGEGLGRGSDAVARIMNLYLLDAKETQNSADRILAIGRAKNQLAIESAQAFAALSPGTSLRMATLNIAVGEVSTALTAAPTDLPELQQKADYRTAYQNLIHESNLEAVVGNAALDLVFEPETVLPAQLVDPDWTARFFNIVQDVSNEGMQSIWGKVLAGEIKSPGSFSLRTLELLRNLSQPEALLFNRVANLVIQFNSTNDSYCFLYSGDYFEGHVSHPDLQTLISCGLLHATPSRIQVVSADSPRILWRLGENLLEAGDTHQHTVDFPVISLTSAGTELVSLIETKAPDEYIQGLALFIKQNGFKKVRLLPFKGWGDEEVDGEDGVIL